MAFHWREKKEERESRGEEEGKERVKFGFLKRGEKKGKKKDRVK